ncbi:efflux RND transporter periplasmic adaptor subunit [Alsobacter soli]|uniref:Efflux RND transporter periplasmic adaptor subunit n=1 Tax=Alsobacter soli TaxID=2109933 RepID=A0A2T1HMH8_9HYPH|nr:efflux RND transporter periplasmic adaptor subunit [Alsobacter soli]PSC02864.1 efflux RND transporter periplasmic adaptor subunit [Alsobacter soli]
MTVFRTLALIALAPVVAAPLAPAAQAAEAAAQQSMSIPAVSVVQAARREMTDRVVVSGTLAARDEVLVSAEIDGLRVTQLLADEGDTVKAGQVLARLSRDTLDAQMSQNDAALARADAAIAQARSQIVQAEAAQVEAQAALGRAQALVKGGNVTQEVLDQRIAAARAADARLAAAKDGLALAQADRAQNLAQRTELQLRIARTEIKAPAAGVVSRRSVKLGGLSAMAGEPMFRIIANGDVELEADVLEMHLAHLAPGAPAIVKVRDGKELQGRVRLLPAEVDRTTRVGKVRIQLPQDPSLRVGAFARGEIIVAQREAVTAPTSALVFGDAGATVQVVRDDKVEVRPVKVGIVSGGYAEIASGLQNGEAVVARAGAFLRDGDAVRVIDAAKTVAPKANGAQ